MPVFNRQIPVVQKLLLFCGGLTSQHRIAVREAAKALNDALMLQRPMGGLRIAQCSDQLHRARLLIGVFGMLEGQIENRRSCADTC